ncbi:MAG: ParA family protein [Candidatus Heimdallarchaeum aukensis]|uniref:ParA family protein n=1 Tax=Candidatus Heimdallarchaeum aukensis TaxID=2876573 RepID=A0A9Y1BN05_9ARCH|nr:MAG: ParA family protein [Candidatus Heimdallarchaeum aukensis]
MKTISVHSYRGGTGKTTFLLNIAGELVTRGKKVLAIDFDLRAPAFQSYFKIDKLNYLSDYLLNKKHLEEVIVQAEERGNGRIDLIFSSMEFLKQHSKQRDKLVRDDTVYLSKLYQLQKEVEENYDYLLIDTTPGFFYRSIDAMMISDILLIVSTPTISNVQGLEELWRNVYSMLKEDVNMYLLINMIEKEGEKVDKELVEKSIEELKKMGKKYFANKLIEIPDYGAMGERIHSFEQEPNKEFLNKISELIDLLNG